MRFTEQARVNQSNSVASHLRAANLSDGVRAFTRTLPCVPGFRLVHFDAQSPFADSARNIPTSFRVHGTTSGAARKILSTGFRVGKTKNGRMCGDGVYTTIAEHLAQSIQHYGQEIVISAVNMNKVTYNKVKTFTTSSGTDLKHDITMHIVVSPPNTVVPLCALYYVEDAQTYASPRPTGKGGD